MSYSSSSYLTIDYRPEARVLVGTWHRSVMPFELQRGYLALLDEAVRRRCRFWLINLSERVSQVNAADVQWMLDEFFPLLPGRLRLPVFLAYVMAPHQLAGLLTTPGMPTPNPASPVYQLERFADAAEAEAWLAHSRRRDARARRSRAASR